MLILKEFDIIKIIYRIGKFYKNTFARGEN